METKTKATLQGNENGKKNQKGEYVQMEEEICKFQAMDTKKKKLSQSPLPYVEKEVLVIQEVDIAKEGLYECQEQLETEILEFQKDSESDSPPLLLEQNLEGKSYPWSCNCP